MLESRHPRILRAAPRWRRQRGSFSPQQISAVSAWLRFAGGTITGSGYSSVPDLLASNPATQGTDANRPPNNNSANGLPRADFDGASDFLSWPAAAGNNTTATGGFAAWVEFDSIADGTTGVFGALPGATNRVEICKSNADFFVNVFFSQFVARRATLTSAFAAATKYFLTWEFYGAGLGEADRCVVTIDGEPVDLVFSNDSGAPGTMPTALVSTAGPFAIGARRASDGLGPMNGKLGPNIYLLGSRMADATEGLLTTTARQSLMNFERPT